MSNKKSSVGICFIGKRKFSSFIDQYLPKKRGFIVDLDRNVKLGEHDGIHHFTVGQRIAVDSKIDKIKKPFFVAKKVLGTNEIFVVI